MKKQVYFRIFCQAFVLVCLLVAGQVFGQSGDRVQEMGRRLELVDELLEDYVSAAQLSDAKDLSKREVTDMAKSRFEDLFHSTVRESSARVVYDDISPVFFDERDSCNFRLGYKSVKGYTQGIQSYFKEGLDVQILRTYIDTEEMMSYGKVNVRIVKLVSGKYRGRCEIQNRDTLRIEMQFSPQAEELKITKIANEGTAKTRYKGNLFAAGAKFVPKDCICSDKPEYFTAVIKNFSVLSNLMIDQPSNFGYVDLIPSENRGGDIKSTQLVFQNALRTDEFRIEEEVLFPLRLLFPNSQGDWVEKRTEVRDRLGVKLGVEYTQYQGNIEISDLNLEYREVVEETGVNFRRHLTVTDATEEFRSNNINIPLSLVYLRGLKKNTKIRWYFNPGLEGSIVQFSASGSGRGTFDYGASATKIWDGQKWTYDFYTEDLDSNVISITRDRLVGQSDIQQQTLQQNAFDAAGIVTEFDRVETYNSNDWEGDFNIDAMKWALSGFLNLGLNLNWMIIYSPKWE